MRKSEHTSASLNFRFNTALKAVLRISLGHFIKPNFESELEFSALHSVKCILTVVARMNVDFAILDHFN